MTSHHDSQTTNEPIKGDDELACTLLNLKYETAPERLTAQEWLALYRGRGYVLVLAEDWKSLTDDDPDVDDEESTGSFPVPMSDDPSRDWSLQDYLAEFKRLGYGRSTQ